MWGMFFGILFVLFFYNLLLYFSIRDISYLWYALSIFFYAHFEYFRTPEFGQPLNEIFFWMKYISIPGNGMTMINLFMVSFLLFTKEFLQLRTTIPSANRWIHIFIVIFSLLSIILLAVAGISVKYYTFIFILLSYLFIYALGIVAWKRNYKPARFFVIASTALLIGVNIIILGDFHLFAYHFRLGVYGADNVGLIVFYILLSLALGDRINILKKEKTEAQQQALLVLEEKVKERTNEVVKQKELIEVKQKEILDSIRYAKRIQTALMANESYIKKALKSK
jgi:hypothetical protein